MKKNKNDFFNEVEKMNIVVLENNLNESLKKKIKEIKEHKENYIENRIQNVKDGWNNMIKKISNFEDEIKNLKENNNNNNDNINVNIKKKEKNKKQLENEEINTNKNKKGNKKTFKKLQECIKEKINSKKLNFCIFCLCKNLTEDKCRYRAF